MLAIMLFFDNLPAEGQETALPGPGVSASWETVAATQKVNASRLSFKVSHFTDKHGRRCTVVQSHSNAFSAKPIAIDCG